MNSPYYRVKQLGSPKGRGLVARQDLPANKVILRNHMVVLPRKDIRRVERTKLVNYVFDFHGRYAIVLGDGSLFNGAVTENEANIDYVVIRERHMMKFVTMRRIKKGEELVIDYGWNPSQLR